MIAEAADEIIVAAEEVVTIDEATIVKI